MLVEAICEAIGRLGEYKYVMETPVLFPTKDRTFYSLIMPPAARKVSRYSANASMPR